MSVMISSWFLTKYGNNHHAECIAYILGSYVINSCCLKNDEQIMFSITMQCAMYK